MEEFTNNIARGLAEGEDGLLVEFLKGVISIEVINPPPNGCHSLKYICVDGKRRFEIETRIGERAIKTQGRVV